MASGRASESQYVSLSDLGNPDGIRSSDSNGRKNTKPEGVFIQVRQIGRFSVINEICFPRRSLWVIPEKEAAANVKIRTVGRFKIIPAE
eukprot:CAMPEP_0167794274 /NCGR_PEP_ID=MMETSP0111_2-20121227/13708_1 /TAXON_ID=91324 /ORGANISM="Lotharella globosa, Strain CCCM811" /LENGTH=88 /DNA_ID=CAMNT_0007687651 /DNA_START=113 /DNA_END=379 /DNA_ORIENTATION=-